MTSRTPKDSHLIFIQWAGQQGGNPGEKEAEGVREAGEKNVGGRVLRGWEAGGKVYMVYDKKNNRKKFL